MLLYLRYRRSRPATPKQSATGEGESGQLRPLSDRLLGLRAKQWSIVRTIASGTFVGLIVPLIVVSILTMSDAALKVMFTLECLAAFFAIVAALAQGWLEGRAMRP